jgi:hypothetical protein
MRITAALAGWIIGTTALIGFAADCRAQGVQTGAMAGVVVDQQQQPVPNVTVTLSSPALPRPRTVTTDATGAYDFFQLPPGDYDLSFESTYLAPVRHRISVQHGVTVRQRAVLLDAASTDSGTVVELPAPIAQPMVTSHFRHDDIDALPTLRDPYHIAPLSPGVTTNTPDERQVSIHGAFAFDNVFTVNGVDIADNVSGAPQNLFVEDAIAETAVFTSGLPAEFGRFTGGVVSAITKSGGNRFSGSYRANLSNDRWTSQTPLDRCDPAVTLPSCRKAADPVDALHAWHEATLGGYLSKDRLWFFTAGRLADISQAAPLPASGAINVESDSNQRGQVRLTAALPSTAMLTFDVVGNQSTSEHHPSFPYTIDPNAIGDQTLPNYYYAANYRAAVGDKVIIETQFATRAFERHEDGAISASLVDSPILTRNLSNAGALAHYNTPYFDASDPEKRSSFQYSGNLTYFVRTAGTGSHDVKGGYEFFRSQRVGGNSQSPSGYVFNADYLTDPVSGNPIADANGRFIPLWVPGESLIERWMATRGARLNVDTQSIYVHDRWAVTNSWSADIGMRYELVRSDATGSFSGVDAGTVAPRLAVSYDVGGRGQHVIHATYGRYAGRLDEALLGRSTRVANPDVLLGVYIGPVGQGRSFTPGFDPANYANISGRFPSRNVMLDGALSPPAVREFTTSYGFAAMHDRGYVQAAYIRRDWTGLIDDEISLANGTTQVISGGFNVGTFTNQVIRNTDDAVRNYNALEFQARLGPRRWTVNGAYTLQLENEGNYPGEAPNAPASTSALGDYPEIFVADRHFPSGRLPGFQRHRLRAWTTADLDLGRAGSLVVSGLVRIDSALTYSLSASDQPLTSVQTTELHARGYPDMPASQVVFFAPRGSESFGGYGALDAAATYQLPRIQAITAWVKLEIYNLFDNQKLIAWDTTIAPDPASPTDSLGLNTRFVRGAAFGTATSNHDFPAPYAGGSGGRTMRISLGVRF